MKDKPQIVDGQTYQVKLKKLMTSIILLFILYLGSHETPFKTSYTISISGIVFDLGGEFSSNFNLAF